MKYVNKNEEFGISCEIEQDEGIGFYLYVYELKTGKCVRDHLQDTLEIAKEQAENDYSMPRNGWSIVCSKKNFFPLPHRQLKGVL